MIVLAALAVAAVAVATEETLPEGAVARLGSLAYKHPAALDLVVDEGRDLLVTSGEVGPVRLRRLSDGGAIGAFEPEGLALATSVDALVDDWLIVDRRHVYTLEGAKVGELQADATPKQVVYRGGVLAGVDDEGALTVWHPGRWTAQRRVKVRREAEAMDLSADGALAVVGGARGVEVVSLADGKRRFVERTEAPVEEVAFVGTEHVAWSDGYEEVVLASATDGAVCWRREPGRPPTGSIITDLGTTGDGAWVVASANLVDAAAWRVDDGTPAPRIPTWPEVTASAEGYGAGATVALLTRASVIRWDIATGRALDAVPGHRGGVQDVAFSPDGGRIASVGREGTARIWEVEAVRGAARAEAGHIVTVPGDGLEAVGFDHEGRLLAGGTDGVFTVVGDEARHSPIGGATSIARGPGARLVAAGGLISGRVRLFVDGELRSTFECETPCSAAPAEGWIAVASDTELLLLDPDATRELTRADPELSYLYDVAAANDRIAVAGWQTGALYAVEPTAAGGVELRRLRGVHKSSNLIDPDFSPIGAVALSADGRWLASGYLDGTVLVEEVETGRRLPYLRGHLGGIEALAFSPDGSLLVSASSDGTLVVWDLAAQVTAEG